MNTGLINIAEDTLYFLEKKSWDSLKLKDIFQKSKNLKNQDKIRLENKKDLLKLINRYFDFKIKKNIKKIDQSSSKDMLFEILMMRFDILQNYRKSILNIFEQTTKT